jgi:predicted Zn-dependent protease
MYRFAANLRPMLLSVCLAALAGCSSIVVGVDQTDPINPTATVGLRPVVGANGLAPTATSAMFRAVVADVEPVAERECRIRSPHYNCDFAITIDETPGLQANAYQTIDAQGRPVIAFTRAMLGEVRNADELAFVLGHEAAHHIAGHLERQQTNAAIGALVFGRLFGGTAAASERVRTAQQIGAAVGSRTFSKDFELQADALGTVIAARAGYDPLKGAQFFARVPDPGNEFLGSHPANADRIATVERTVAGMAQ